MGPASRSDRGDTAAPAAWRENYWISTTRTLCGAVNSGGMTGRLYAQLSSHER
jgi:hypothetical protein